MTDEDMMYLQCCSNTGNTRLTVFCLSSLSEITKGFLPLLHNRKIHVVKSEACYGLDECFCRNLVNSFLSLISGIV